MYRLCLKQKRRNSKLSDDRVVKTHLMISDLSKDWKKMVWSAIPLLTTVW